MIYLRFLAWAALVCNVLSFSNPDKMFAVASGSLLIMFLFEAFFLLIRKVREDIERRNRIWED